MTIYTAKHKIPFQIDPDDAEAVSYYTWCMMRGYPCTNREKRTILLHEFLMGKAPKGLEWDHRNRDKSDNRRQNFRLVTKQVQQRNTGTRKDTKSGTRGVSPHKGKWAAYIAVNGKLKFLGYHFLKEEAIMARKKAEIKYWGEHR